MSKELKKLYKSALKSMNYFFLQVVFIEDFTSSKTKAIEENTHLYEVIKCELKIFLEMLHREKIKGEISIMFKEELAVGEYLSGKTIGEIEYLFGVGISKIFKDGYPELLDFYMSIVEEIKK